MTSNTQRLETRLRSFFGLKSIPFAKDGDTRRFFETTGFLQAKDRLRYLVDRRGIGVIFGAPGTGKSTLLRAFLDGLSRTSHAVAYVPHTTCAVLDLYRNIARSFQLEPPYRKADVVADLKERIQKLSRGKKVRPVLVLDDAHLLPANFLDELRLLTSYDRDGTDDLTLVLAGQPQFESNLRLAVHEAFSQRIVIRIRLRSLHPEEVEDYITFRLEAAGRTAKLFLPDAVEAIAKAARGVPRLIDRMAEHSLLIAMNQKAKEIDAEIVTDAIEEVDP
jgi:type II secretory pathway predicted ATPase ExeA